MKSKVEILEKFHEYAPLKFYPLSDYRIAYDLVKDGDKPISNRRVLA